MPVSSRKIALMGTKIVTKIWHEDPEPILDQVDHLLFMYKDRFSANDPDSELMQVNHAAGSHPVTVAPDLFELIALGKKHSSVPGSHLNITIGPLIQTWRIGFSDARRPSQAEIEEKLAVIDPSDIILDSEQLTVFLRKKGMAIDLGALAKGYIADKIVDHLKRAGVQKGLINLGGNVLTFGVADHHPTADWMIGIQHPSAPRGTNLAIVRIKSGSVVTSGVYERTFTVEGKTYHHIFDQETGYPVVSELASLTIVSEHSVDGEIWTTRLFGKTPREIFDEVNQTEGIEAILITHQNELIVTNGLLQRVIYPL
ncbi:FAD:protein FMN transferase [Streptococcus sp. DD13]|uniref:FAD:protein FMN transferase n=1 Tax=Streptococcus sp. DD13 TaxID=1777881 RepID=UPI000792BA48|nr:FAD:protein FMN transferase [Streptococcus sp. DD13]KXT78523.1 putative thiamine biosynthesis lipoprotein [Streptococcus sp. DD13]